MAITDLPEFIRADGPDKVTGSGRYAADMTLTGQLVAKFLYGGVSHGAITKLDVEAARSIPGVFAVLTACLLYTSPSPRDRQKSRMPSSA